MTNTFDSATVQINERGGYDLLWDGNTLSYETKAEMIEGLNVLIHHMELFKTDEIVQELLYDATLYIHAYDQKLPTRKDYVFFATNEKMPNIIRIGSTSKLRSYIKAINREGMGDFEVIAYIRTDNFKELEKHLSVVLNGGKRSSYYPKNSVLQWIDKIKEFVQIDFS